MSRALAERIILAADRVYLAERWLEHGNADRAREALDGVHERLVALAEEVDR